MGNYGEYRNSFSDLRDSYAKIAEFKGHLSEGADTLLACLEFENGLEETFSQLTNVDMKFGVLTAENGKEVALSQRSVSKKNRPVA
jgi:oligoendopeptidase F